MVKWIVLGMLLLWIIGPPIFRAMLRKDLGRAYTAVEDAAKDREKENTREFKPDTNFGYGGYSDR